MAPYFVAAGVLIAVAVLDRGRMSKRAEQVLAVLFALVVLFGALEMWRQSEDNRPTRADCFNDGLDC